MSVFAKASASRSKSVKSILSAIAVVGVGALVLSGCTPADDGDKNGSDKPAGEELVLKIGTLLPQTGGLAFLGPPEEAGVALAVKEVNEAKMGITIEVTYGDSGDPENKAYATTVPNLLSKNVTAIVGAAASGVSKLVLDQVIDANTILFSPANTSPDFTDWDDNNLYWRTAPSDLLQGEVLGNLIAEDGHATLGIIALNDAYGTGLEKVTKSTFETAGGTVTGTEFFNTGDTQFSAQINAVLAENPAAIALISFDEAKTIIPALKNAGFDTANLYLVDGNTSQYNITGDDALPAGVMTGAKGTQPGPALTDDFVERLRAAYAENNNGAEMGDALNYAAESYDAVILLALAALAAGSTDAQAVAGKLREVSGGTGDGEKATDFKSAAAIINAGKTVDYDGMSGGVKFDEAGDPTQASIGVYQYDTNNLHTPIDFR